MSDEYEQYCEVCGTRMKLLFVSFFCPVCDAKEGENEFDDNQKTPTMWVDLGDFLDDDDFGFPSSTTPTLPLVSCTGCGSTGFSGSICHNCQLWRP